MQYLRGWRAMRQDPEWTSKVGVGILLMLIPIVGPFALYGWQTLLLRRVASQHRCRRLWQRVRM